MFSSVAAPRQIFTEVKSLIAYRYRVTSKDPALNSKRSNLNQLNVAENNISLRNVTVYDSIK